MSGSRWAFLALRWIVGAVFIVAGVMKIREPDAFAAAIGTFELLPPPAIPSFAPGLAFFEILAGSLLLTRWHRPAALCIVALSVLFALALAQAPLRGLDVECGCFGAGSHSPWKSAWGIGRDVLLAAAGWLIYSHSANFTSTSGHSPKSP